jgi:hypothetical protein
MFKQGICKYNYTTPLENVTSLYVYRWQLPFSSTFNCYDCQISRRRESCSFHDHVVLTSWERAMNVLFTSLY